MFIFSLDNLILYIFSYWQNNRWDKSMKNNETISIHALDGEIYAQLLNLSSSYDVFFHGPSEIIDIARQRYKFSDSEYTTVGLSALEIITTENAKEYFIFTYE